MSNIEAALPVYIFGYWRPWKEDASISDSFLDFAKDTSLVRYGADTVGKYIKQASKEQVEAINQLGENLGMGMDVLSRKVSAVNRSLSFLNTNLELLIDQQKLSNLLLSNIAELLRIPNSEKERQHSIEMGIKFFVNAAKDTDLYADALEEFLKAEALRKQDYFVLHRIGSIYMHVERYIDIRKALDYFVRAAKYASVESSDEAVMLANVLTNRSDDDSSETKTSTKSIGLLAADSYHKAAFAAYVLGEFDQAVNFQKKAKEFDQSAKNMFLLAKYLVRNGDIKEGIEYLDRAIDDEPELVNGVFKEIDLVNEPEVIKLLNDKNNHINEEIDELIEKFDSIVSSPSRHSKELKEYKMSSYENKVKSYRDKVSVYNNIDDEKCSLQGNIDELISRIEHGHFVTYSYEIRANYMQELAKAKDLHYDKMIAEYERIISLIDKDIIRIGGNHFGGIIFYIDKTGEHGLVCADKDFEETFWGGDGDFGAYGTEIGTGRKNTEEIVEYVSYYVENSFWGKRYEPAPTAARICMEASYNGYNDWFLPSKDELEEMYEKLFLNKNIGGFERTGHYWSSSADNNSLIGFKYAWDRLFWEGFGPDTGSRDSTYKVRAVRAF